MPLKPIKKPKQRTGRRYSKNQMIAFAEMVAHEQISETNVAAYFTSMYEGKESGV